VPERNNMDKAKFIQNSLLDDELLPFAAESQTTHKLESKLQSSYDNWKAQDNPTTRNAMLSAVQPTIDRTVSSYGSSPYLQAQAKKLALQSLRSYDPQLGKFQTHLQTQLRGLTRLSGQDEQIISIPERVMLDRQRLRGMETELEDRLGRPPNMDEIANHTGLTHKRIGYIRQASATVPSSKPQDATGAPTDPAVSSLYKSPELSLWERLVYDDLSNRDKLIYDTTLGMNGTKKISTAELADRLNVTPAVISQRRAAIQQQLDQELLQGG